MQVQHLERESRYTGELHLARRRIRKCHHGRPLRKCCFLASAILERRKKAAAMA